MENKKAFRLEFFSLLVLGLFVIFDLLNAVVFGATFAFLVYPVYNKIKKKTEKDNFSAFITTLGTFFIIILPMFYAIREVAVNAEAITGFLVNLAQDILQLLGKYSIIYSGETIETIRNSILGILSGVLISIPGILIEVLIMVILLFYFLRDGDKMLAEIYNYAQDKKQMKILDELKQLFKAVIYGYFTTALVLGVLSYISLVFLNYPNALILSILVGITGLIPVLGPWVVYIFLALGAYLQGDFLLLGEIAVIGIVLQGLLIILPQKLTSGRTQLHPVITLLGFIGGPLALGLKGLILGPLILGTVKVIITAYWKKNNNH